MEKKKYIVSVSFTTELEAASDSAAVMNVAVLLSPIKTKKLVLAVVAAIPIATAVTPEPINLA